MQHRTLKDNLLLDLVSDYEDRLKTGANIYFSEKEFSKLINSYESDYLIDKALVVTDHAIQQFSFQPDFYIIKARLLLRITKVDSALELLEKALQIAPGDNEIILMKARVLCKNEDYDAAFELVDQLLEQCDQEEFVDIKVCEAYIHECCKNYEDMFQCLSDALEIDPDNYNALERMWLSVELSRKYKESVRFHKAILDKRPYNYLAWYNLGHAFSCIGEYEKAILSLEYAFLISPDFDIAYLDCAELCEQVGNHQKALDIYKESLERFGPDSEILLNLGSNSIHLNQFERAKEYLLKASRIDPYNDEVFYHLGICYSNDQKWKAAINAFSRAISIEDRREEYYAGMASVYMKKQDWSKTDYYYRKATETAPEQDDLWYDHASFLFKIEEYKFALEVLEDAENHTYGVSLLYCKAACQIVLGETQSGLDILTEALEEDFESHELLFELKADLIYDEQIQSLITYYKEN